LQHARHTHALTGMDARLFECQNCRAALDAQFANTGEDSACPSCGRLVRLDVFPALLKPIDSGSLPEHIFREDEAGCFYHPDKKAVVPCSACGRFLCALCDVPFGEQHLCPGCLQAGQQKGRLVELENKRTLYDSIAISLAVVPLIVPLFWFLTLLTAPFAIGMGIYALKKPLSLVRRTYVRAWLAIGIGVLEIGGWGIFAFHLIQTGMS
jgi:hypothetical protein